MPSPVAIRASSSAEISTSRVVERKAALRAWTRPTRGSTTTRRSCAQLAPVAQQRGRRIGRAVVDDEHLELAGLGDLVVEAGEALLEVLGPVPRADGDRPGDHARRPLPSSPDHRRTPQPPAHAGGQASWPGEGSPAASPKPSGNSGPSHPVPSGIARREGQLGHPARPGHREVTGEGCVADEHVGDPVALAARQPGGDEGVPARQLLGDDERAARTAARPRAARPAGVRGRGGRDRRPAARGRRGRRRPRRTAARRARRSPRRPRSPSAASSSGNDAGWVVVQLRRRRADGLLEALEDGRAGRDRPRPRPAG